MKEKIFEVRHKDVFESKANEHGWRTYVPQDMFRFVKELTNKHITFNDIYEDKSFLINVKLTDNGNFMIIIIIKDREYIYLFKDIDSYTDEEDTVYLCEVKKLF